MAQDVSQTTAESTGREYLKTPEVQVGTLTEFEAAIRKEHELTFGTAVRLYPKAIAWCVFVNIGIIMLAFDQQLLGNLYATPKFQRDFGHQFHDEYVIDASWQSALSMGSPIGQVVGALVGVYPMDRFGRRLTFIGGVILIAGLVAIQFSARSLSVLLAGELLAGLVAGVFVVLTPAYASEVCPTALRGHTTAAVNLSFVTGELLANIVTAGTQRLRSHWAYSLPFALQWAWIAVLVVGMLRVPESPWWLVRQNRLDEASEMLARLASKSVDVGASLTVIVETNRLEQELEAGSTYADCFRSVNRRRTEIAFGVYCTQVLSGIYLVSYTTFFTQQAGLGVDDSFNMSIGFLALGFVGTVLSWGLLLRFGRRPFYVVGLVILSALQLLVGIVDCIPSRPSGASWAEASLLIVWNFFFDLTIGPACYIILGECSATRVKSKTIAAATAAQGIVGVGMTVAIPYMINPQEGNMQGKTGFVFSGLCALCFVWSYFRVPETRGRTYDELDVMFARGVSARDFESYKLE